MSKKKNTLKDLDEFLKQQAATLASPDSLDAGQTFKSPENEPGQTEPTAEISLEKMLHHLEALSKKNRTDLRNTFYELILLAANAKHQTDPEDKMLINTVLYLKHGEHWKDAIRAYWRKKG